MLDASVTQYHNNKKRKMFEFRIISLFECGKIDAEIKNEIEKKEIGIRKCNQKNEIQNFEGKIHSRRRIWFKM